MASGVCLTLSQGPKPQTLSQLPEPAPPSAVRTVKGGLALPPSGPEPWKQQDLAMYESRPLPPGLTVAIGFSALRQMLQPREIRDCKELSPRPSHPHPSQNSVATPKKPGHKHRSKHRHGDLRQDQLETWVGCRHKAGSVMPLPQRKGQEMPLEAMAQRKDLGM